MRKLFQVPFLLLSLLAFVACGDDSDNGPGFTGPDLSGTWRGSWADSAVNMVLDQNGAKVTGTLSYGREVLDLTGTVTETGIFAWTAVTPATDDCIAWSSTVDDFEVSQQNTLLTGPARRAEGLNGTPENPCGTRTYVQNGLMSLERAF